MGAGCHLGGQWGGKAGMAQPAWVHGTVGLYQLLVQLPGGGELFPAPSGSKMCTHRGQRSFTARCPSGRALTVMMADFISSFIFRNMEQLETAATPCHVPANCSRASQRGLGKPRGPATLMWDLPACSGGPATLCDHHTAWHGDLPSACLQNSVPCPGHSTWSMFPALGHHGPGCPCSRATTGSGLLGSSWPGPTPWAPHTGIQALLEASLVSARGQNRGVPGGSQPCPGMQHGSPAPASPSSLGRTG